MFNEFWKCICVYIKLLCNGLGEEICKEGSFCEDCSCWCRYIDGYVFVESF